MSEDKCPECGHRTKRGKPAEHKPQPESGKRLFLVQVWVDLVVVATDQETAEFEARYAGSDALDPDHLKATASPLGDALPEDWGDTSIPWGDAEHEFTIAEWREYIRKGSE